ncbi:carbohydrate kinase family protein [Tessaracoccus defluvii]|uniref:hypothetical protein n=1 Tax=Tessaracoccus defluvii TaxID=1285901 RepID=UPI001D037401|nr:hypothetical protein [Tessaracoccus defluvii]
MDTEVVTFTANPSLDRTIELSGPLCIGAVQRAAAVTEQAGGKGLNVARVLMGAGRAAVAVAPEVDASFRRLAALAPAVPLVADDLPTGRRVRINTAITEPDGTTTKVNESGPALTTAAAARAEESLAGAVAGARWAVLSGSLPPGPRRTGMRTCPGRPRPRAPSSPSTLREHRSRPSCPPSPPRGSTC